MKSARHLLAALALLLSPLAWAQEAGKAVPVVFDTVAKAPDGEFTLSAPTAAGWITFEYKTSRNLPEGEKVLIQGIIDVFFIEDGEIVLLDYKTDVIDSLEALWNRYNVQIQYYEEALTKLMQMPVKERILYSFYLEKYE